MKKREDCKLWFEQLSQNVPSLIDQYDTYDAVQAISWFCESRTAIESVFPVSHSVHRMWTKYCDDPGAPLDYTIPYLIGVIKAAASLVRNDRLNSLIDQVRTETEGELLDQAEILWAEDLFVASAAIAGGAMETHLRYLVAKHVPGYSGKHSISAYNQEIGQERNKGNVIYSKAQGDLVGGWGKIRNDATHDPGNFEHSPEQVSLMIQGIRLFVANVA